MHPVNRRVGLTPKVAFALHGIASSQAPIWAWRGWWPKLREQSVGCAASDAAAALVWDSRAKLQR